MEKGAQGPAVQPYRDDGGLRARGNMMQVRQIAGMRGLVANPEAT